MSYNLVQKEALGKIAVSPKFREGDFMGRTIVFLYIFNSTCSANCILFFCIVFYLNTFELDL